MKCGIRDRVDRLGRAHVPRLYAHDCTIINVAYNIVFIMRAAHNYNLGISARVGTRARGERGSRWARISLAPIPLWHRASEASECVGSHFTGGVCFDLGAFTSHDVPYVVPSASVHVRRRPPACPRTVYSPSTVDVQSVITRKIRMGQVLRAQSPDGLDQLIALLCTPARWKRAGYNRTVIDALKPAKRRACLGAMMGRGSRPSSDHGHECHIKTIDGHRR